MKTKLKIIFALLVCGILSSSAFAASKNDVATFLKEYETFVVATEKAATKNDLASLSNMSIKAAEFSEKVGKLQADSSAWTVADLQKYNALAQRYTTAVSKMYGTSSSFSF